MKKIIKMFFAAFMFVTMITFMGAFADDGQTTTPESKSILALNVSVSGNSLLVGGTTEDGVLAVAIAVYDKSGKNLVTMQTTDVNDDNTYESSLELDDGSYVIKVADYDGGSYLTKSVDVGDVGQDSPEDKKPSEKDNDVEVVGGNDAGDTDTAEADKDIKCVKNDKRIVFPKTDDERNYILIVAVLGISLSSVVFISRKSKKVS